VLLGLGNRILCERLHVVSDNADGEMKDEVWYKQ
jgi:hypothetical protein